MINFGLFYYNEKIIFIQKDKLLSSEIVQTKFPDFYNWCKEAEPILKEVCEQGYVIFGEFLPNLKRSTFPYFIFDVYDLDNNRFLSRSMVKK